MAIRNSLTTTVPQPVLIRGPIAVHESTKQLLRHLEPESIAVIFHDDLDDLAAEGLLQARVRAVINAGQTMTGTLPAVGCLMLLEAGVPVLEIHPQWFPRLQYYRELSLTETAVLLPGAEERPIPVTWLTRQYWLQRYQEARHHYIDQLDSFIDNTLAYAQREKDWVLQPLICPTLKTQLKNRPVLVAVRGSDYKQELQALSSYIKDQQPVLIAVDGGADALLELGYVPDLIVGDMDSVTDAALHCGAELIVHAYLDGRAPGFERIRRLGLEASVLPACGTSEDAAMLLAHDHECERIVAVGAHAHMLDFLQKGRKGMGSTLLVRMKIGSKLIDAKGLAMLQESGSMPLPPKAPSESCGKKLDEPGRLRRIAAWVQCLKRQRRKQLW
ncbi:putative cytokinetic ring protein SteA [Paenibacillus sp. TAB 01]|uniref:putative cytokinetic ring protein SteA n=1 Tax=Paenibacillus sp. TAB 01 TaxID=3368988 RepID=UPI0037528CAC